MIIQSWKPRGREGAPQRVFPFNGAMIIQSWKRSGGSLGFHVFGVLQRSHDYSIMETIKVHAKPHQSRLLQRSHDYSIMETG